MQMREAFEVSAYLEGGMLPIGPAGNRPSRSRRGRQGILNRQCRGTKFEAGKAARGQGSIRRYSLSGQFESALNRMAQSDGLAIDTQWE